MLTNVIDKIKGTIFHKDEEPMPVDPIKENNDLNYTERNAGRAYVQSKPYCIELETTTRCNLDCLMCPRLEDFVEEELSDPILEKVSPWFGTLNQISLHGFGEPLYSPATFRVMSLLPDNTQIHFSSNLTPLKPEHIELFRDKKGLINVSLDAGTAETYKLVRGANFDKVVANMKKVRELSQMDLYMNMTVMQVNKGDVPAFLKLAEEVRASRAIFIKLSESYDFSKSRKDYTFVYSKQHLLPEDVSWITQEIEKRKWPFAIDNYVGLKHYHPHVEAPAPAAEPAETAVPPQPSTEPICAYPWVNLYIRLNGEVRNCCHQEAVGNLHTQTLDEIWNSDLMQEIRQGVASKNLHAACQRVNCPVWRDIQSKQAAGA